MFRPVCWQQGPSVAVSLVASLLVGCSERLEGPEVNQTTQMSEPELLRASADASARQGRSLRKHLADDGVPEVSFQDSVQWRHLGGPLPSKIRTRSICERDGRAWSQTEEWPGSTLRQPLSRLLPVGAFVGLALAPVGCQLQLDAQQGDMTLRQATTLRFLVRPHFSRSSSLMATTLSGEIAAVDGPQRVVSRADLEHVMVSAPTPVRLRSLDCDLSRWRLSARAESEAARSQRLGDLSSVEFHPLPSQGHLRLTVDSLGTDLCSVTAVSESGETLVSRPFRVAFSQTEPSLSFDAKALIKALAPSEGRSGRVAIALLMHNPHRFALIVRGFERASELRIRAQLLTIRGGVEKHVGGHVFLRPAQLSQMPDLSVLEPGQTLQLELETDMSGCLLNTLNYPELASPQLVQNAVAFPWRIDLLVRSIGGGEIREASNSQGRDVRDVNAGDPAPLACSSR
jgi:hypothetical protein